MFKPTHCFPFSLDVFSPKDVEYVTFPRITMTAPTVRHRDVGDKYATGVPKIKKIRGRENIAVRTWNVRTLRPAGKLEQLTHAMSRYHWNILGLCEMRWKKLW